MELNMALTYAKAQPSTKNLVRIVLVTAALLMIPLIAMQFTTEVVWTGLDFTAAGVLLIGTGLLLELARKKLSNVMHRRIAFVAILFTLLFVWAQLAVGIFGS
jgi:hypothetical protein